MIYELNTYTLKTGSAPEVAKISGSVGRDIRGDDYGKLEGYWITEIGQINQVMHLWSYASFDERSRLRGELAKNERWQREYLPLLHAKLIRRDVRLLNAVIDPIKPASDTKFYEYRNYRCRPGGAELWVSLFLKYRKVRERYSKIVAMFTTEAGQPNEVSHIWAYPDLNARNQARTDSMRDSDYQAFLAQSEGMQLTEEMHCTIMLPAPHSPLG